eukprot:Phypoly_transcript_15296.p1 GENE.Phypoly_transcript_15296~~Phypoly_transcript_15296.p1  ORF type:complete len:182 (+),score=33.97 Phypoly_transcript_15296:60-605(+)
MSGFAQEAGNTVGVEKSVISYSADIHKLGNANGWTSSQLPLNLTKGKYKIELDIVGSPSNNIMIEFAKEGTNLLANHTGAVANSWGYYCANGNKYVVGTASVCGQSAKAGEKITLKFSFDNPTVRVFKNNALVGYMDSIQNKEKKKKARRTKKTMKKRINRRENKDRRKKKDREEGRQMQK